jgi:hypothetical protein
MFEASFAVADARLCISGGSATGTGLDSHLAGAIIVPLGNLFPSLTATLGMTRVGHSAFHGTKIASRTISPHVQIICSECFSFCNSLSLISFESDSELGHIE